MSLILNGTPIVWTPAHPLPLAATPVHLYVGNGQSNLALNILIMQMPQPFTLEHWRAVHTARAARGNLVVIVGIHNDTVILFGPDTSSHPTGSIPIPDAARILNDALHAPDFLAARDQLIANLANIRTDRSGSLGLNNSGLFANHELSYGVPQRPDWATACRTAEPVLAKRGIPLIEALGFRTQAHGHNALLMNTAHGDTRAIAVLLNANEHFDGSSARFAVSPVAHGLAVAQRLGVPWLIVLRDANIRLYPARPEYGIGRKGLAETYCELNLSILTNDNAGYLNLLFSAAALAPDGSIYDILANSNQYAVALGKRLRDKVYATIVPTLSVAVANQFTALGYALDRAGLDRAYQVTLRIFFRLLFQAYAEDRRLLPYGRNATFDAHSLNAYAQARLAATPPSPARTQPPLWSRLQAVWAVIDRGDPTWSMPAYNGGLFAADPEIQPDGALISQLTIEDAVIERVLDALLIDADDGNTRGAIDFRSLSVREFGTIYEGLLESNLAIAEHDLTLDASQTWVPAKAGDRVDAPRGGVYFHNTSGQRKGTGSYFTPAFVVEHLIERSLLPALGQHLDAVKALHSGGEEAAAGRLFFDFRVADIAMGSGHFLTAAIDHIENKMAAFLADTPIPAVKHELIRLAAAARAALPDDTHDIEESALLRRQIARRCIYGLDINPIAVELARVSIWIHTFVRGLPMSTLDHNLVCANSLTGIGTVDEALDVLIPTRIAGQANMFAAPIQQALEKAKGLLLDIVNADEATSQAAHEAAVRVREARTLAADAKYLFDAAVLMRIGQGALINGADPDHIAAQAALPAAQTALAALNPAHMPVLFPEVFLRDNGGFDVLLGNPPWEEVMLDEAKFWLRHRPGLMSIPSKQRLQEIENLKTARPDLVADFHEETAQIATLRKVLLAGPFPDLGKGDIDVYRVFAWRNWQLIRQHGDFGLVLPRSILNSAGNSVWRETLLIQGSLDVTVMVNGGNWIFSEVDGRYSICLISGKRDPKAETINLSGPFHDLLTFQNAGKPSAIAKHMLLNGAEGAAFPSIPDPLSLEIYKRLRISPRLDAKTTDWDVRLIAEMHATADRPVFDSATPDAAHIKVYGGASFNIWEPSTGEIFAYAEPTVLENALFDKRQRQIRLNSSGFYGMPTSWAANRKTLVFRHPRLAYRQITNSTNTRTVICALVPPETVLTNAAPFLFFPNSDRKMEAYLLGVLSSIPFDWYARRHVELNFNFHILYSAPIPRPAADDPRRLRVISISGRLAAIDARYQAWADAVGVPVGSVTDPHTKDAFIAELDALVAHLYGLDRAQLCHMFATFHRGWDYQPRLSAVLSFYDALPEVTP